MAGGVPAGTLSIEIVAEVAKLQEDMRRVQKAVGDMSSGVAVSAKAVNDNLRGLGTGAGAGIQQFSKDVARLKAQLDPAWAATQRYKEEIALLQRALGEGAISHAQYVNGIRQAAIAAGLMADKQAQAAAALREAADAARQSAADAQEAARQQAGYAQQASALRAKLDPMFAAQERFNAALDQADALFRAGTITAREYGQAQALARQELQAHAAALTGTSAGLSQTAAGMQRVTASAGAQRAGLQQLGFQMQDVAVQVAGGTSAMQAFGQQIPQAIGAISMMGAESGRFAAFMGGPWGVALGVASAVLLPLIGNLFDASEATKAHEKAAKDLATAIDQVVAATNREARSTSASIRDDIDKANSLRTRAQEALRAANAELRLAQARASSARASISPGAPGYSNTFNLGAQAAQEALAREAAAQVAANEKQINELNGSIRLKQGQLIQRNVAAQFDSGAAAGAKYDRTLDRLNERLRAGTITNRAYEEALVSATRTRNAETDAAEKSGRAQERHARGLSVAEKAARALKKHNEALAKSEADLADAALRSAYAFDEKLRAMDPGSLAAGIIGAEPAKQLTVTERLANDNAAALAQLGELTGDWCTQLDSAIDRLARLGGLGRDLAGWAAALRGDLSGLSGPAGALVQTIFDTRTGGTVAGPDGSQREELLGDRIAAIFKKDGDFARMFKDVLEGAGTGISVGASLFGQNNSGAQLGGAIGGILGKEAGKALGKVVGGSLGKALGPLGEIAGSILGSVLGSVFSKKPRGSGTVTNAGVTTSANDGGIKSGLDSFGLGLQQSVSAIADKLGGTVGDYSVGIGAYKDYYQVSKVGNDPYLGQTYYNRKSSNAAYDGKDAAAALRAAIAVAIEQGAIQGVRAGTQTLLKAGSDIEAQLAKALKFEGAFQDLQQATDPVGYALDQITRKFDDLRKIFTEAGATTAEFAQLEQLLALQRADALEQARQDEVGKVRDSIEMGATLLSLLGRSEQSLAATRTLELASVKASLQPMQALIYQLEDAQAVIDKFGPLADDLRAFKRELLGNQVQDGLATLTARFREVAALAKAGDATAMGQLRDVSGQFLEAAKANAGSQLEYQRALGEVLAAVDQGIFAADSQVDYQQAVIDTAAASQQTAEIMARLQADMKVAQDKIIAQGEWVERIFRRWDGEGLRIQNDSDTPVYTQAV